MKRNNAQVLNIILWILIIISILAISINHRVSLALKISRYQKNKLNAVYLAYAGLNRAIAELLKDAPFDYDSLADSWANNSQVFEKIILSGNGEDFAAVNHISYEEDSQETTIFGVVDEERKININTVSEEILISLLEECKIANPQEISDNIRIWRGDKQDTESYKNELGYSAKGKKFTIKEELLLARGITKNDYEALKQFITVYGNGSININTVPKKTLKIFTRGIAKEISTEENEANFIKSADSVAEKIINLRGETTGGYFNDKGDINIGLTGSEEPTIFNSLTNRIIFKSNNFLVESCGTAGKIKKRIMAVYARDEKKTLYWYES